MRNIEDRMLTGSPAYRAFKIGLCAVLITLVVSVFAAGCRALFQQINAHDGPYLRVVDTRSLL